MSEYPYLKRLLFCAVLVVVAVFLVGIVIAALRVFGAELTAGGVLAYIIWRELCRVTKPRGKPRSEEA